MKSHNRRYAFTNVTYTFTWIYFGYGTLVSIRGIVGARSVSAAGLFVWPAGRPVRRLVGWLVGWLIGRSVGRSPDRLAVGGRGHG
jgi:hypothetical protein